MVKTWKYLGLLKVVHVCAGQDAYEELVMTVGSRRSGLNQNMALKNQYERVLQDLIDLVDTAQDKMTADQKMIASSVEDVHSLLDKHKVHQTPKHVLCVREKYVYNLTSTCVPKCFISRNFSKAWSGTWSSLRHSTRKLVPLFCHVSVRLWRRR